MPQTAASCRRRESDARERPARVRLGEVACDRPRTRRPCAARRAGAGGRSPSRPGRRAACSSSTTRSAGPSRCAAGRHLGEAVDEPLVVLEQQRPQRPVEQDHVGDGEVHALGAGRRHGVRGIADERQRVPGAARARRSCGTAARRAGRSGPRSGWCRARGPAVPPRSPPRSARSGRPRGRTGSTCAARSGSAG